MIKLSILLLIFIFSNNLYPQDPMFLGMPKDKVYHAWAGFFISGVTSLIVYDQTYFNAKKRIFIALSSAFVLGLSKELYDSTFNPSYFHVKDIAATVIGAIPVCVVIKLTSKKRKRRMVRH